MKPAVERNKRNEMLAIWNSYEWLIKEKLQLIDGHARQMTAEMRTFGIPADWVVDFLPKEFNRLMREVAIQQEEERHSKGGGVGG